LNRLGRWVLKLNNLQVPAIYFRYQLDIKLEGFAAGPGAVSRRISSSTRNQTLFPRKIRLLPP